MRYRNSLFLTILTAFSSISHAELSVYSLRTQDVIEPLIKQFTESTGIKVKFISASGGGLIQRLINEGSSSPADVVIANGIDDIHVLSEAGIFKKLPPLKYRRSIYPQYIARDNSWVAFAIRARVMVYNKKKVTAKMISQYQDLSSIPLKNLVCARPSGNSYDPALVASILNRFGEEKTLSWLQGFVSNFSRAPHGNDRAQIRDVARGVCGVALINNYYLGLMYTSQNKKDVRLAKSVGVVFPNSADTGTHINGAAAGITHWTENTMQAEAFINYLTSFNAQNWITKNSFEFPIRRDVLPASEMKQIAKDAKFDDLSFSDIGKYISKSVLLIDNAGWR